MDETLLHQLIPYYFLYRDAIKRVAEGTVVSDNDKNALATFASTQLPDGTIVSTLLEVLITAPEDVIRKKAGKFAPAVLKIKTAWGKVRNEPSLFSKVKSGWEGLKAGFQAGAAAVSNGENPAEAAASAAVSTYAESQGAVATPEVAPQGAVPTESSPATSPAAPQYAPAPASTTTPAASNTGGSSTEKPGFFQSVGNFFSNGFDMLSLYGTSIQAAFKSKRPLNEYVESVREFRRVSEDIQNSDLTEDQKKLAYKNLVQEAHERMGMDEESASKATSYMFDTLKIPTNMIIGTFSNAGDFLKEVFTPQKQYNIYEPLTDQAMDRYLTSIRSEATDILKRRQSRYGVQNLIKMGLSEPTATKIVEYMKHPVMRQMLQAGGPQIFNALLGAEQGAEAWSFFQNNMDVLLNGFQGDGTDIFDRLSLNTFSESTLYAFGEAANALSTTPSVDNQYARSSDYVNTIKFMQEGGVDFEKYAVRGDLSQSNRDVQRLFRNLSPDQQEAARTRFVETQRIKAMEKVLRDMDLEAVYDENGNLNIEESAYGDSGLESAMQDAGNARAARAEAAWTSARDGMPVEQEFQKELPATLVGQTIAKDGDKRTQNELSVASIFGGLRGAREALGGKEMDTATARQLIRAIGDSNLNADDDEASTRTRLFGMYMQYHDIDFKKTMSAASLVGETAKQLKMNPAMAQQAQLFGAVLFNNRMANRAQGEFVDKDRALAVSMQNATRVMNGKAYRELAWLETAVFNDTDKGKQFQAIREKLRTGQDLTSEDWDLLNSDKDREEAFAGNPDEYSQSRNTLDSRVMHLSLQQQTRAWKASIEKEQGIIRHRMRENDKAWSAGINPELAKQSVYTGDAEKGISAGDELRSMQKDFVGLLRTERIAAVLSGSDTLTEEESQRIAEALGQTRFNEIDQKINAAAKVFDDETKKAIQTGIIREVENEAQKLGVSIGDYDTMMSRYNQTDTEAMAVREEMRRNAGPDKSRSIVESILAGGQKTPGQLVGAAFLRILGGPKMDSFTAGEHLMKDYLGARTFLFNAATSAKNAQEYFAQGWGTNANDATQMRDLINKFKTIDPTFAWDSATHEEMWQHITAINKSASPENAELRRKYAELFSTRTDYGLGFTEMISASDAETVRSGSRRMKDAYKKGMGTELAEEEIPVPETPTAPEEPSAPRGSESDAPEASGPMPADGGTGAPQVATAAPAVMQNDEQHPTYVRLIDDQAALLEARVS